MARTKNQIKNNFSKLSKKKNKCIYSAHGSTSWRDARSWIITQFKMKDCWDIVSSCDTEIADNSYPCEVTFDEIEPLKSVEVDQKLREYDDNYIHFEKSQLDIINNSSLPLEEKIKLLAQLNYDLGDYKTIRRADFEGVLMKLYYQKYSLWKSLKETHQQKVNYTLDILIASFSWDVLSLYENELYKHHFRKLWKLLDTYCQSMDDIKYGNRLENGVSNSILNNEQDSTVENSSHSSKREEEEEMEEEPSDTHVNDINSIQSDSNAHSITTSTINTTPNTTHLDTPMIDSSEYIITTIGSNKIEYKSYIIPTTYKHCIYVLQRAIYDGKRDSFKLHIQYMVHLQKQCHEEFNHPINDREMVQYIIQSFQRSSNRQYDPILRQVIHVHHQAITGTCACKEFIQRLQCKFIEGFKQIGEDLLNREVIIQKDGGYLIYDPPIHKVSTSTATTSTNANTATSNRIVPSMEKTKRKKELYEWITGGYRKRQKVSEEELMRDIFGSDVNDDSDNDNGDNDYYLMGNMKNCLLGDDEDGDSDNNDYHAIEDLRDSNGALFDDEDDDEGEEFYKDSQEVDDQGDNNISNDNNNEDLAETCSDKTAGILFTDNSVSTTVNNINDNSIVSQPPFVTTTDSAVPSCTLQNADNSVDSHS